MDRSSSLICGLRFAICKEMLVRVYKVQCSLDPNYTGPFRVVRRWSKCFRILFEHRYDDVSVDSLQFYQNETDTNCETGTKHNRDMTNGEKTNNKPEAEVLGGRSRSIRTVCQPNRWGFGFIHSLPGNWHVINCRNCQQLQTNVQLVCCYK